jgi:hypothetical protein
VSHNALLHSAEAPSGEAVTALVGETTRLIVGYLMPA